MTCANWKLTVLAVAILVITFFPTIVSATVGKWIVGISTILILVITWTLVECKVCKDKKKGKK